MGPQGLKGDQGPVGPQGPNEANLIYMSNKETTVEQAINSVKNNLSAKADKTHNHDSTYLKKTGSGTLTGDLIVAGTIKDSRGNLVGAGPSNSVAIVWSSAMRFDVYVDNIFVGTLTPVK